MFSIVFCLHWPYQGQERITMKIMPCTSHPVVRGVPFSDGCTPARLTDDAARFATDRATFYLFRSRSRSVLGQSVDVKVGRTVSRTKQNRAKAEKQYIVSRPPPPPQQMRPASSQLRICAICCASPLAKACFASVVVVVFSFRE